MYICFFKQQYYPSSRLYTRRTWSLGYLDSSRGIAAMMVFVMHFFERIYLGKPINAYLTILCNGRDAVSFFFVLSGFVLSYRFLVLGKPIDLKQYYVSRFFRLWPAFFIAVIFYVLWYFYSHDLLTGRKLADIFIFNSDNFWEEAFLVRFHNLYYSAGWTLTIEMVGSFLLPFYLILAKKDIRFTYWLVFVFIVIAGQNFFCSVHFLLGMIICFHFPKINREHIKEKKWFRYRYLILLAAFIIFPIREYNEIKPFGSTYIYLRNYLGIEDFLYTAFASAVFLVAIIYSPLVKSILGNRVLVYIGKLSYSIYLVHVLSLHVVFVRVDKHIFSTDSLKNIGVLFVCYAITTFIFAWLMHNFVELPGMKLGKKIVSKMKPSIVISAE